MPSEALLGPAALLVAAIISVGVLWKVHLEADADDRRQRDTALELLRAALAANSEHAAGNRQMAEAWDRRNRQDAERSRRSDR